MLIPIERMIYTVGCSPDLISLMRQQSEKLCGIRDAKWIAAEYPADGMRGFCVILSGIALAETLREWTSDTEVMIIAEKPDISLLRQGFVDVLSLPLDCERFAASFANMVCRCERKRRIDIREHQLKTYYEISDDMLWTKDMGDLHMDINHVLISLVGKPRQQIEGKHEIEVYGLKPDAKGCKDSDRYVRTTGRMNYFEESMPGADGKLHHLRVTKAPWLDGQGRIIGTIGLAKDVTAFMNQKTQFDLFLNDLELGVVIVDNAGRILQANKVYLGITGTTKEEIVGQNADNLQSLKLVKSTEFGEEDYIVSLPDNQKNIWTRSTFHLYDYWSSQYGYAYIFRNVTLEREQRKKIISMAVMDQLTGLPNRTGMYEYFNTLDKSKIATFLFTDIDNFKQVNDQMGHDIGDRLLMDVGALFRSTLSGSFTARMGGDEFISVIDGGVGVPEIEKRAEALLEGIKRFLGYPKAVLDAISFSIGILPRQTLSESFSSIVRKCDGAMYQAKRAGKNRYQFYHPLETQSLPAAAAANG